MADYVDAPGTPGLEPRWTTSAKTGVGRALSGLSRVSFTLSHGILNEVYYPRHDEACLRDLGLIVTDGVGYFSEEKRSTDSLVRQIEPGAPAYHLTNRSRDGRYTIEKRIVSDPERDVVLQKITFRAHIPGAEPYKVFALLAPHLVNAGAHNTATVQVFKGWTLLVAEGGGRALALACSARFKATSVGYVGESDGYTLLKRDFDLKTPYTRAADGNVALCGELDFDAAGEIVLAVAFGRDVHEAVFRARSSIMNGYENAEAAYVSHWVEWQKGLEDLDRGKSPLGEFDPYRVSTAVMKTHESRTFHGGMIASLSLPWGAHKGDGELGGYHLVWPRDLVESATALLAMGAHADARDVLTYLQSTQEEDGHWAQNMWLDGSPYWNGIQMDETAFPILLVGQAYEAGALHDGDLQRFWPMVRQAVHYLVINGPATGQDRWEEDGGYSPFTLAVEVSAMVVAADIATRLGHPDDARYLLETADLWNESIERWTYATGTDLAREAGVSGYYVRISPEGTPEGERPVSGSIDIKNVTSDKTRHVAAEIISPDALALVRFGLRSATDPKIVNTVKVIDRHLKVDLPQGSLWYRYNEDGYGEQADGSAFDGVGIGRAWPLMAGERAHYELAAGNLDEARRLLEALEHSANASGFIPEQSWEQDDIPELELHRGRPSGSAMPLVWAHGEHIKLLRSLRDGVVFDLPKAVAARYAGRKPTSDLAIWRFSSRITRLEAGRRLKVEVLAAAQVRWTSDEWSTAHDVETAPTSFGVEVAILDTSRCPVGSRIIFTLLWTAKGEWEGTNFTVAVVPPAHEEW